MPNEARCLSCGSESKFLFSLPHTSVYRCRIRGCGLKFAHPQLSDEELSEANAGMYSNEAAALNHDSTPAPYAGVLLEALSERTGPFAGRRVLDFGAGTGTVTRMLLHAGAEVIAVELDATGRERILADCDIPVVSNLDQVRALRDGPPFDVIVMIEVIEHLRQPRQLLSELRGLLRPGGHIFVTTPNVASLKSRLEGVRWANVAWSAHLAYFDRRSIVAVLRMAGFAEVERLRKAAWHPVWGLPRRVMQPVLMLLNLDGGLQFIARRPAEEPQ
jgi:SAM-dependent methyltransferase